MSDSFNAARIARLICWEAISTIGESAAETALLLRAGISNVSLSRFVDDSARIKLCSAPALPEGLLGLQRSLALASCALLNLASTLRNAIPRLAERNLLHGAGVARTFRGRRICIKFRKARRSSKNSPRCYPRTQKCEIEYFPFGRAAGALALQKTIDHANRGYVAICGGVDTQYDWPVLEALAGADRLLTSDNVDGLRPGEGAAFLVIDDGSTNCHVDVEVDIFAVGLDESRIP